MDSVGEQYDYTATFGNINTTAESNTIANVTVVTNGTTSGWVLRNEQVNSTETRTGNELIAGY
jgi:hypothetical protein